MKTKVVKKVLMCRPLHFDVSYVINPWMKVGSVDRSKAIVQWEALVDTYKKLGIEVEVIDQDNQVPDMVFAADQGIVKKGKVAISNFRFAERRGETLFYRKWFENKNYDIVDLPNDSFFEGGGESVFVGDTLVVGYGIRTSEGSILKLRELIDTEVVGLELIDPYFYHLDLAFFPVSSKTAFYYPPAFSARAREKIKKLIPNLITLTRDEAYSFVANSMVTDHHIVMQKGNRNFAKKVEALGYKVINVDLSEFLKSGGAAHCLTGVLEEGYE